MQELVNQLSRLYLSGENASEALARRFAGEAGQPLELAPDGATRAVVIPFERRPDDGAAGHWERLCALANALQGELGLPAPAVSISGASGYRLWLSFAEALAVPRAQQFLDALWAAYCPGVPLAARVDEPVEVPPCLHQGSGKWAAFIHPGMGASFADEPGLEMAPPLAAQAAFLDGLESITPAQLERAFALLQRARAEPEPAPVASSVPVGLLLKDATLEDIVRHLHSKNIEPTFRHLLPPR